MSQRITIREERPADIAAIFSVVSAAFERDDEARLVDRLRAGGWVRLSQVALFDGQVVGHVLWSDLAIVDGDQRVPALALAPVAVVPQLQSQGIGSQLIRAGLKLLRERGHRIAIVLGHQHYYPRFGFSPELARPLDSPYAGDSFMALELAAGALADVKGRVEYPPPFSEG
jgi:putative acetyltransferase